MSSALEEEELLAQMRPWRRVTPATRFGAAAALEELGYLTEEYDGHYGATTADCVSRFQEANGLTATGWPPPRPSWPCSGSALREDGTPLPDEAESSSSSESSASSSSAASEVPLRRALPAVQSPPRTVLPLLKAPPLRKGGTAL